MRFGGWLGFLLLASGCVGCGATASQARYPAEKIPVPDGSEIYTAEARPDGVTGGPGADEVEAELSKMLRARGGQPQADGALGATACWILREANEGRQIDMITVDLASRSFGFGGVLSSIAAFGMGDREDLRETVETMPKNVPLTRYGICVSPSGSSAAVALGNMEASYDSIRRAVEPGQEVTLKGELTPRFRSASVYITKPDGSVSHKDLPGRAFHEVVPFEHPGVYRLEVMGNDSGGPSIVINLPVYVGVPAPVARGATGVVSDPKEAEPRLLALLNEARAKAGVRPLRPDGELVEIARAHSEDMIDHHFFAHVSPNTGTPEDRARRANVLASKFGENIGVGPTPEEVHEGLMNSPGHRMNMLLPDYTHVGIAAEKSENSLVVTVNFARRPDPEKLPATTADVENAVRDLRAERGLKPYAPDPVYRGAAQSGADALARGADEKEYEQAVQAGVEREVNRLRTSRPAACTVKLDLLELPQLTTVSQLLSPELGRLGIGTRLTEDKKGKRLSTVFLLDGPACKR
ncbi:MAG TPA: CAP domain-containing protein [Polyangiaceae bacterium]